jgi:uncharacterized protein YkwD
VNQPATRYNASVARRRLRNSLLLALVVATCTTKALATDREDVTLDAEEASVLEHINEYRVSLGLVPLTPVPRLNAVAFAHSLDMGRRGYFGHIDPEGRTPFDRMARVGYDVDNEGENLAAGRPRGADAFTQWRRSPSHDAAMRDPTYRAIGIGRVALPGSRYEYYWTAVFGDEVRVIDFDASSIPVVPIDSPPSIDAPVHPSRRVTYTRRALPFAPRARVSSARH